MRRHHHHHHHHHHVPTRLRRRILFAFGGAILVSLVLATVIGRLLYDDEIAESRARIERFASAELAKVWRDPAARDELVDRLAATFLVQVTLTGTTGETIVARGPECAGHAWTLDIARDVERFGAASVCVPKRSGGSLAFLVPIAVAGLALWGASGRIAHRLTRPLARLAEVTQEIGAGRYDARADTDCRVPDEVSVLGEAINDMAAKIERQLKEQKMLLAAVSHELRTPLGHLRILVEMAREQGASAKTLDDIEREIRELDDLVGELLARSRLDLTALTPRPLDARELAERALDRAGLPRARLELRGAPPMITGDPTLLLRALANLIDNAARHGGGLERLVVEVRDGRVLLAAEDRGPGVPEGAEARIFEPFYRRDESGTLGLGLALVDRIARAHAGSARAENRPEGGARVSIELPSAAAAG